MLEYKHLIKGDLDFLEAGLQKMSASSPIVNGRSKKININNLMIPVGDLLEAINGDKTRVLDENLKKKLASELLVYTHIAFLEQFPSNPLNCLEEFKANIHWIKSSDLSDKQEEALAEVSKVIEDAINEVSKNKESAEAILIDRLKNASFASPQAKLQFWQNDPRYDAIDEISMLGTFIVVYGDDHYSTFRKAADQQLSDKTQPNFNIENSKELIMTDIKEVQVLDRANAELAIEEYIVSKLGMPLEIFLSKTPGVIAMERPSYIDEDKIDFEELAAFVSAKVGVDVVAIDHCDWSFDDDCDQEAIYIAFDVPELEPEYREENSNLIKRDQPTPMKT